MLTIAIASPLCVPLYRWEYAATSGQSVIWTPIALLCVFLLGLPYWLQRVHRCSTPWQTLGFCGRRTWWLTWLIAFAIGVAGVGVLYGVQLLLGWGSWVTPKSAPVVRNLLEGLLVGLGVGFAEEIVFRGWLLFELEQDYSAVVALWINAGLFAIAHYLRPLSEILATWPQFAGLLLLGCVLVWSRRIPIRTRQPPNVIPLLSPAVGLHSGLVFAYYQVDVNDLISASNTVPPWVTGIGGNPLAGVLGFGLLGAIAVGAYTVSHSQAQNVEPF
jgi:membrane protease YdiL (CAAX protease family)